MTNDKMTEKKYDLEERTTNFGEAIIKFSKKVPKDSITLPLVSQLLRAGTSIGANYCEADDAETGKDFKHKIGICKKEARETKYWLKMIIIACPELKKDAEKLRKEAKELHLIFNAITHSYKNKNKKEGKF